MAHRKGSDRLVPSILRNEYRSALPKRVSSIVQRENSAAFQNIEGFVDPQVSVDRNAAPTGTCWDPLGEIVGAYGGADLDADLAAVAKTKEMFAFSGAEHIPLWCRGLSLGQC